MTLTEVFDQFERGIHRPIHQPFIIAEAGVNHEGSIELAKRLIDEAAEGGADAIKFQTYKAEKIASRHSPSYWDLNSEPTTSQFQLFKKYDKFWKKEFEALKQYCDQVGIEFLSTPFDVESATFLNDLMNVFKISSSDITNLPFIEFMCRFEKPILLSTGASFLWEIHQAVEVIKRYELPFSIMHCILNYPTPDDQANLGMIQDLKKHFPESLMGYSDHTLPKQMKTLEVAALLGAVVLEKHFTHDKTLPGNDHYHAMDKEDLKNFRANMKELSGLLGSYQKAPIPTEDLSRQNARRSLVATRNLQVGDILQTSDLTWKRPANGVSPKYLEQVLGSTCIKPIEEDQAIQWQDIEPKQ